MRPAPLPPPIPLPPSTALYSPIGSALCTYLPSLLVSLSESRELVSLLHRCACFAPAAGARPCGRGTPPSGMPRCCGDPIASPLYHCCCLLRAMPLITGGGPAAVLCAPCPAEGLVRSWLASSFAVAVAACFLFARLCPIVASLSPLGLCSCTTLPLPLLCSAGWRCCRRCC